MGTRAVEDLGFGTSYMGTEDKDLYPPLLPSILGVIVTNWSGYLVNFH